MRKIISIILPVILSLNCFAQWIVNPYTFGGGGGNGLLSPTISYYKLDESSGILVDSKSAFSSTSATGITYGTTGKLNTAVTITNTSGNGIGCGFHSQFSLTSGSISVWVFITSGAYIVNNMDSDNDRNGWALQRAGSTLALLLGSGSGVQTVNTVSTISLSTWYHVVATWDGSNVKLYLNGTLDNTVAQTTTPTFTSFPLTIGTGTGSDGVTKKFPMGGIIDELAIFNTAITSTQVTTLNNSGTPLPFASFN